MPFWRKHACLVPPQDGTPSDADPFMQLFLRAGLAVYPLELYKMAGSR